MAEITDQMCEENDKAHLLYNALIKAAVGISATRLAILMVIGALVDDHHAKARAALHEKRLVPADRKVRCDGPQCRLHAVLPTMWFRPGMPG